ncbi:hypothetical protein Pyrfu_1887 [Pyrolobus fumarii 1A]|uniref:Uncharacterized protein n=1 Tax=Pyrolobus fumarii (strain DSM 11204 / 1A) TaxID=694429 RepID=G0ED62_PYRF1|nr:hypothetical protein [Pyrolobus fumarii]AEM39740.1 hypothetical protein Pyrfu_1887 [Pyrolobus fumarii 1A]
MSLRPFKLILGTPVPGIPRPWQQVRIPGVMVSAYTLLTNPRLRELARGRGLRRLLGLSDDVELWIDSGGYQFMRKGFDPGPEKLAALYREIDADFYVSLDYPPRPREPLATRALKVVKTIEAFNKMRSLLGGLRDRLVPVFHLSWGKLLRIQLHSYSVAEAAAIGGLVPLMMQLDGKYSRRRAVAFLALMRRLWGSRLHALGLASAAVIPLLRIIGIDSGDTQTWRHKAAYGKVIIPGLGERHVSGREVRFGPARLRDGEELRLYRMILEEASRELGLDPQKIAHDFVARAVLNAWVLNRVAINGYGYLAASRAWLNLYQYASELVRRDPGEIEMEIEKMALEAMKSLAGGTAAK